MSDDGGSRVVYSHVMPVTGKPWHVAVRGLDTDDPASLTLVRVAAWAVVDNRMVAMVPNVNIADVSQRVEAIELAPADVVYDVDSLIGIVQPGDQSNPFWQEKAKELAEVDANIEREREINEAAKRISSKLGSRDHIYLAIVERALRSRGNIGDDIRFFPTTLVALGLIRFEMREENARCFLTDLGVCVYRRMGVLDRSSRIVYGADGPIGHTSEPSDPIAPAVDASTFDEYSGSL